MNSELYRTLALYPARHCTLLHGVVIHCTLLIIYIVHCNKYTSHFHLKVEYESYLASDQYIYCNLDFVPIYTCSHYTKLIIIVIHGIPGIHGIHGIHCNTWYTLQCIVLLYTYYQATITVLTVILCMPASVTRDTKR